MRDVRTAEGLAKSRGVLLVSDRQPAFAEVLHFVLRALDQRGARAIIEPARNWFQPKNGNQPALADKRSARGAGKETGSGSFYGASVSTGSDAGSGCNLDPRATAPSGRTPR
jgi:hypothetical protein